MFRRFNERVKKLTVIDVVLIKWAVFCAGILCAKIFPQFLQIPFAVLIGLVIVCSAKPCYVFWIKK